MNLYAIPPLITVVILTAIGLIVFFKNRKSKLNIIFSLLSFSMAIWLFGYTNMYLSRDTFIALKWARIGFLGVIFIPVFAYHFIISFLNLKRRLVLPIIYSLTIPSLILSQTNYIYGGIKKHSWGYYPIAGKIYILFLLMFGILFTRGVVLLFIHLRQEREIIKREQINYVCLAFGFGTLGIVDYLIKYPILDIYPFGYICALLFTSLIAIAIVRYRLMDIKIVVIRIGNFALVYSLFLIIPFWLGYTTKSWLLSTMLAVFFAILATLLYLFVDKRIEERLLKKQKNYQHTLKQPAIRMMRMRDFRQAIGLIVNIVAKSIGIKYAAVYFYDPETNEFILQRENDKTNSLILRLTFDHPLIVWIMLNRQSLIYEEVKRQIEKSGNMAYKSLEENMRLLNAAVIIPCFLEDRFMGFIVLGEKISGQIYTLDDLNMFQVVANQATVTIKCPIF